MPSGGAGGRSPQGRPLSGRRRLSRSLGRAKGGRNVRVATQSPCALVRVARTQARARGAACIRAARQRSEPRRRATSRRDRPSGHGIQGSARTLTLVGPRRALAGAVAEWRSRSDRDRSRRPLDLERGRRHLRRRMSGRLMEDVDRSGDNAAIWLTGKRHRLGRRFRRSNPLSVASRTSSLDAQRDAKGANRMRCPSLRRADPAFGPGVAQGAGAVLAVMREVAVVLFGSRIRLGRGLNAF